MPSKIKILITSVGSLVGQNIQDVLEFSVFNRRDNVELIGTNSIAGVPNNFRCNRCYLVSNTETGHFKKEIKSIIKKESPDLILSGRDEDTEAIAFLMEKNKDLPGKLPYGKAASLKNALNKLETWNFCNRHELPFAATFVLGNTGDLNSLKAFIENYDYPLIAKPIQGFASKGVFFVRSWSEVEKVSELENYMFQEYLGDPSTLTDYFNLLDGNTPLFAHAPNIYHHSCHTVIKPDGSYDPVFISRNEHDSGVTIGFRKVENEELTRLTHKFIAAIYKEQGYGPVTIQFRKDRYGTWKAQEMNMRTNGNTFPRFLMGQDDLGLIMEAVLPEKKFPVYRAPDKTKSHIIGKTLSSYMMQPEKINLLKKNKKVTV